MRKALAPSAFTAEEWFAAARGTFVSTSEPALADRSALWAQVVRGRNVY